MHNTQRLNHKMLKCSILLFRSQLFRAFAVEHSSQYLHNAPQHWARHHVGAAG